MYILTDPSTDISTKIPLFAHEHAVIPVAGKVYAEKCDFRSIQAGSKRL